MSVFSYVSQGRYRVQFVSKPSFVLLVAAIHLAATGRGDIRGCFNRLQAGLELLGFDPDKDRLFSVGDLVDWGPESAPGA